MPDVTRMRLVLAQEYKGAACSSAPALLLGPSWSFAALPRLHAARAGRGFRLAGARQVQAVACFARAPPPPSGAWCFCCVAASVCACRRYIFLGPRTQAISSPSAHAVAAAVFFSAHAVARHANPGPRPADCDFREVRAPPIAHGRQAHRLLLMYILTQT
ncbi:unnamed protein product, partial [Amoebophrya sp. A120]|eukprot:GSA120T00010183001.1